MSEILVISGHPDHQSSFAGKSILEELGRLLPAAEIVRLDALYPNFKIDAAKEQARLAPAKTLVFEYPFWWYGSPSLMHRYVEQVFTHGYAYGSNGDKLRGKKLILSFTTGGSKQDYSPSGAQGYDISAFLPPFLAMAKLCGLDFKGSVISFSMALIFPDDAERREEIALKAKDHAARLAALIGS